MQTSFSALRRTGLRVRWVVLVVAVLATACGSGGSPWWYRSGTYSCGPPALIRVSGHIKSSGACTGNFVIPAPGVTVHVGQKIDVHMAGEYSGTSGKHVVPVWPLLHSSPPSALKRGTVSVDKTTATYTARRPGHAALITNSDCYTTRTGKETYGRCPVLNITVIP